MKKLLLIILLIYSTQLFAQRITLPLAADSTIEYSAIIKTKDTTIKKDHLYSLSKVWFANVFHNSNYVLQVEDPNAGRLLGKGSAMGYDFTFEVLVKDGKYKYRVYDLRWNDYCKVRSRNTVSVDYSKYIHNEAPKVGFSKKHTIELYDGIFKEMDIKINNLIASLNDSIISQQKVENF